MAVISMGFGMDHKAKQFAVLSQAPLPPNNEKPGSADC